MGVKTQGNQPMIKWLSIFSQVISLHLISQTSLKAKNSALAAFCPFYNHSETEKISLLEEGWKSCNVFIFKIYILF